MLLFDFYTHTPHTHYILIHHIFTHIHHTHIPHTRAIHIHTNTIHTCTNNTHIHTITCTNTTHTNASHTHYMFMSVCPSAETRMCQHVEAKGQPAASFLRSCPTCFLRQDFSPGPGARMMVQQTPGIFLSLFPHTRITGRHYLVQPFS